MGAFQYPRLKRDKLEELLAYLQNGDNPQYCSICKIKDNCCKCLMYKKTIQEVVIEAYVPYVIGAVNRFCAGLFNRDDFISAGILGVVKAVNKISERTREPHKYIYTAIVNSVKREMINNTLVPVPRTQYKKETRKVSLNPRLEVKIYGDQESLDLSEIIESIPDNEMETLILTRALMRGYKEREIAEEAHCTQARVNQIKNVLLCKLLDELRS